MIALHYSLIATYFVAHLMKRLGFLVGLYYLVDFVKMNFVSGKVLFEVKEGHLDEVKQAVETRLDALTEQWKMYLPAQLELVENAQTYENGNYYFMVISESADETIAFIQGYFQ